MNRRGPKTFCARSTTFTLGFIAASSCGANSLTFSTALVSTAATRLVLFLFSTDRLCLLVVPNHMADSSSVLAVLALGTPRVLFLRPCSALFRGSPLDRRSRPTHDARRSGFAP